MSKWKPATALIGLLCLLISRAAAGQQGPPPPGLLATRPDSSLLRPARLGQTFPYAHGVTMELGLYRRITQQAARADTLLASKNSVMFGLSTQLGTAEARYQNSRAALAESQAAGERQQLAYAALYADFQRLDKQKSPGFQLFAPGTVVAAAAGLVLGLLLGVRH